MRIAFPDASMIAPASSCGSILVVTSRGVRRSGDIDGAANFVCGGNLESHATVCADVLVKLEHEVNGELDNTGTGVNPGLCERSSEDIDDR
jgi:hypothetical protein